MVIIFDNIIFAIQKAGGISVVWSELLKRLLNNKKNIVSCIEYNRVANNICRKEVMIPATNIHALNSYFLNFTRYFSPKIINNKKFIFHSSYYRICSNPKAINITTVHDFTYEYYYTGLKKWIHLWQKYRAISKSDYIICISENTKQDLLKFLPDISTAKIRVIYNGVSDDYYPLNKESLTNLPFELETYVLFVGSREKYKNFELAVKAIAWSNLKLIVVGAPLSKEEVSFLCKEIGSANFIEMGRVSNEKLNRLYNGALTLLYPSEYEGFGIPVLEAQKAGCPVIAYNASSIPEIIGDTPLLLNTLSIESITKCFEILKIEENRRNIIYKGFENVKRFTWDKMYEQVIALYKEAWGKSKR